MTTPSPRIDKTLLANRFGSRVSTYDSATPVQAKMAKQLVNQARDYFDSGLPLRILELGCGTGRMTIQLATAFPDAKITALDISVEMIKFAKTHNFGVDFVVADAEVFLRVTADTYDLIISNAVIQWFEDADTAIVDAYNKLSIRGLIMLSTFGDQTFTELNQAFRQAYFITGQGMVPHTVPMRTLEEWRGIMSAADISEELQVRHFPDVRQFLGSVQEAGAVNSLFGQHFLNRNVLREMIQYYSMHFSDVSTGYINATYHVIYLKWIKK